jgi:HAD superfamily hydrolase (TIGR01509 family)
MSGPRSVDAVVFDFDGVILDTEGPVHRGWAEVYTDHGLELPIDLWTTKIGTYDAWDQKAHLESALGRPLDWDSIEALRRARTEQLLTDLEILDGVTDWLDEADGLGLRVGIASSSPRDWVHGFLDRHGLAHRFEVARCRDDVSVVKPDPELYASAVAALGADPSRAIAVEDSPNGIRSAKAAGLFCVAVPHDLTRGLPLDEADLVLGSLSDRSLASVIELVGDAHRRPVE